MNKLIFISLALFHFGASCSFKRPEDKKDLKSQSELQVNQLQDSDGDLETDLEEKINGTNPYLADIPNFQGEYFEEMKLTTHFHNNKTNKFESVSFQVRKNITSENGTPAEERDFLSKRNQFIIEENALLAKRANYKASSLSGDYNGEDIGYFSPPRMNDLQIFPYSERVSEISKNHDFEEIEFFISNRLNYSYSKANTYTDLVFDLYWFNDITREFNLIGTDFLSGVYQFGADYNVPLSFKTNEKELVRIISLAGGRFLYLKLRDFKIIENGKFYKQVLNSVKEKSIPVIYFDGENEVSQYVGTNGGPARLESIIQAAIPEKLQIYNSRIVGIGQKTEKTKIERDAFGESEINQYRFQLLTNEISNNPFTYSFSPGDILTLSYVSSSDPYSLVPSYFGAIVSSEIDRDIKTIKILRSSFNDLRLNLRPKTVKYTKTLVKNLIPCSVSANSRLCWSYKPQEISLNGVQAIPITYLIKVKLNDKEFWLDELLASKDALFRIKNSQVIEIKFKGSLLTKIPDSNGLTITFSSAPRKLLNCEGEKACESIGESCEKFLNNPPECTEANEERSYSIIDNTKKIMAPVIGQAFLSLEYI